MSGRFFSPHIPPAWMILPRTKLLSNNILHHNTDSIVSCEENNTDAYYTFNSLGYREKEYAENYSEFDRLILAIGPSCVFGINVRNSHCWPRLLENSLPNTRVLNFGVAGASMDSISRMTSCLIPYFKSRCRKLEVVALWAVMDRREIFLDDYMCSWSPPVDPPFPEFVLGIDDTSSSYNHEKNETMVRAVCSQYDVPLYVVSWDIYENATKDGEHPTAQHHREMLLDIVGQIK